MESITQLSKVGNVTRRLHCLLYTSTERIDLRDPFRMLLLLYLFQQSIENFRHISDKTEIYGDILVDFRIVDIDLRDDSALCEVIDIARNTVAEASAYRDQEITLINRLICLLLTVHSDHSQRERMLSRNRAEIHESRYDRDLGLLLSLIHI